MASPFPLSIAAHDHGGFAPFGTVPFARDGRLDRLARLAASLTGQDAALAWFLSPGAPLGRWGGHGVPDAWPAALALIRRLQAPPGGAWVPATSPVPLDADRAADAQVHHALLMPLPQGPDKGAVLVLGLRADVPAPTPSQQACLPPLAAQLPDWLADTAPAPGRGASERRAPSVLELRLRGAMRAMQMGSWVYDVGARRLLPSADAAAILGVSDVPTQLDTLLQTFNEQSAQQLRRAFVACIRDGRPIDEEVQLQSVQSGEEPQPRWVRFIGEAAIGVQGAADEIHGAVQDVSSRKLAQEETLRLAMRLTTTLASITEAFVTLDREGRFMYVNHESEALLGQRTAKLLGEPIWRWLHGAQAGGLQARLRESLRQDRRVEFEDFYPALDKWLEVRAYPYAEGLAVYFRDISERKAAETKIHRLAFFDALTGLPNRQLLIERLETALTASERTGQAGALMFIDLDNFKVLNDTMGHHKGDLLLQRVAERLGRCVRRSDTVARLGGDEFVVMLQDLGTDAEAAARKANAVASKVLARMTEPFELGGYQHYCTISIGVTLFAAPHDGVAELLKQADLAMYQAKSMGRNTVAFFDPAMQAAISASAALSADLRTALQGQGQFTVHYQPQFDQASRVVGMEALLRWHHPERGPVSPAEFIPIAEDTGLILPLGAWVLEQACAQLVAWAARPETAQLSISVNVSVRQFRHPEFVDMVMGAIDKYGVEPRLLKLELTESLLAERMEVTLAKMDVLKQLGVTLSLDDFGTGYSSLGYLKRLPLDQLKIDQSFVADVLTDPSDAAIARAIIELAHSLELKVLAEGVETEAQRAFLAERGCDFFQGFLLARPMPLQDVDALMARIGQD
ncbi:MAG: EAL domain-containing protein [Pseudomonadota bacterium]|nr:EAL domain-containing protein [Pseudomonadota bacterium]